MRRALELVAREAALPRRTVRADPGLLAARDAVDGLVERWDDAAAGAALHAATSISTARWPSAARSSRRCASATARCGATATSSPTTRCAGSWRLRGERGHVDLAITMAPTVPPLVQTLVGRVGAAAVAARSRRWPTAAARLASEPAADGARARCSRPASTPAAALRGLRVAAALYGPFGDAEPIAGDGETTHDAAAPGPRAATVELELELDEGGERLARLVLRPAGLTDAVLACV